MTPAGEPSPGFHSAECKPVAAGALAARVMREQRLEKLRGRAVRPDISLTNTDLLAFEIG